ncbi:hypothetical protein [Jiangella gansuensis]|uniref:hypothetical protein n=1 Tax=Jiangella gansuensis TaxID=281473 RepID=UPI0004B81DC9|nr:hypothetical protein [Jiangella gansuensis]
MTRLNASLPKGDGNGLGSLELALTSEPHRVHVVLMLIDCKKITTDADTGDIEATARIRRIEPIPAEDRDLAGKMLRRAFERRTGKTVLPFDLEQDVIEAFGEHPARGDEDQP